MTTRTAHRLPSRDRSPLTTAPATAAAWCHACKRDSGRCFIRAGWKKCGASKDGKLIFEKVVKNT
jgi:hypothetical protein